MGDIDGDGDLDALFANDSAQPNRLWIHSGCGPTDLGISKSDFPDPVLAGNILTYTIVVSNTGPDTANGVIVTDALPPGGVIMTNLGAIAVGGSASFMINVTVDSSATGVLTNTATVTSSAIDTNPVNDMAIELTTVNTEADLVITKSCPATVPAGDSIAYTIIVANRGPSDAQTVEIIDTLPTNVTPSGATMFAIPTLAAGASTTGRGQRHG